MSKQRGIALVLVAAIASAFARDGARAGVEHNLLVHVTWADGADAEGVGVRVAQAQRPSWLVPQRKVTDAAGRVAFHVESGRVIVGAERFAMQEVDVVDGAAAEVTLAIEDHRDREGRVVDALGEPIEGAEVLLDACSVGSGMFPATTTDSEGRFRLRAVADVAKLGIRHPNYQFALCAMGPDGKVKLTWLRAEPLTLRGVVRRVGGGPVAGAQVELVLASAGVGERLLQFGVNFTTTTDAEGRYEFGSLPSRAWQVTVRAKGLAAHRRVVEPASWKEDVTVLDVDLDPGWTVRGIVTDETGTPIRAASVSFGESPWEPLVRAWTGVDGGYVLDGLPPCWNEDDLELIADHAHCAPSLARDLDAHHDTQWNPVLTVGAPITGVLLRGDGRPWPRQSVWLEGGFGEPSMWDRKAVTDAEGRFEFLGVPDGDSTLRAGSKSKPIAVAEGVRPGREVLLKQKPATVTGRLVDSSGRALKTSSARLHLDNGFQIALDLDAEGHFECELAPGGYLLSMSAGTTAWSERMYVKVDHGAPHDLGDVEVAMRGRVVPTIWAEDGVDPEDVRVWLWSQHGGWVGLSFGVGSVSTPTVPMGHYTLHVRGDGVAAAGFPLLVQPDTDNDVSLVARRGTPLTIEVARAASRTRRAPVDVVVRTDEGVWVTSEQTAIVRDALRVEAWVGAGRYVVTVSEDGGPTVSSTVDVTDAEPATVALFLP